MTEIPEHLLRRSRERRAALGLGDGEEGAGTETASSEAGGTLPAKAAPTAPARTASATPAAPARAEAAAAAEAEAAQAAAARYIAPPTGPHKSRVPVWVMPVLVALPLWAFFFPGAFGSHKKAETTDPITIGSQVYRSAGCSGCHGAAGEGGVGPPLHAGASAKTFPNIADQINWVKTGSAPFTGKPYGDPNRAGGQAGPAKGVMPAFGSSLSPAQIEDVVMYERTKL